MWGLQTERNSKEFRLHVQVRLKIQNNSEKSTSLHELDDATVRRNDFLWSPTIYLNKK